MSGSQVEEQLPEATDTISMETFWNQRYAEEDHLFGDGTGGPSAVGESALIDLVAKRPASPS